MLLPISRQEMSDRGWSQVDIVLVTGDAYVDHYSFGSAIIGRYLESLGFKVAILAEPNWKNDVVWQQFGRPKLGFFVTSGNLDSLLSHYTAGKKVRRIDLYAAGGRRQKPDYAVTVYGRKLRELYPDTPIVLGGLEASLRRFAHYDYWSDTVMPSVLVSAAADLLIYGMGELAVGEVAQRLQKSGRIADCYDIAGLAYRLPREDNLPPEAVKIPSFQDVSQSKRAFAEAFALEYQEQNFFDGQILAQKHEDCWVVVNRPMRPLSEKELDQVYELPFERIWHPFYDDKGGVPAYDEVKFSLLSHRGCFGGCNFCALNFHQGRIIQSRSAKSLIKEAKLLTALPDFKGYLHDVGGPTANFRGQVCQKALKVGPCRHKECLYPYICNRLPKDSGEYEKLLTDLRRLPKVKKVFVRSGIRFDYALAEKSRSFLHTLCRYHVSGQLKVAPEHLSDKVLSYMGKCKGQVYHDFKKEYTKINQKIKKKQFLVPYFMSSHPGSTLDEAVFLAKELKKMGLKPKQVQDFIPTPGTISTCMYYTGLDPRTMQPLYVAKTAEEKSVQRALLQPDRAHNKALLRRVLTDIGRKDLLDEQGNLLLSRDLFLHDVRAKSKQKKYKKSPIIPKTAKKRPKKRK